MSHDDSLDEETRKLLEEIDKTDDSLESDKSNKNKGKTWTEKDENGNEYETNDVETPDIEW